MQPEDELTARPDREPLQFTTTRWTLVVDAARKSHTPEANAALNDLCCTYWQPIFAFVRSRVSNPEDARDLTQGFFADLLSDRSLRRADPQQGRFRSFLLGALKHFLADERDRAMAKKRGGGVEFVPLDIALAETRYGMEASVAITPETQFDRGWALAVLDRGLLRLRPDFVAAVTKALVGPYPGVPVFPAMSSNASEWFRNHGVPSYGASPMFTKKSENFSHGLNERTPIANIAPAIDYYLSLVPDLSK